MFEGPQVPEQHSALVEHEPAVGVHAHVPASVHPPLQQPPPASSGVHVWAARVQQAKHSSATNSVSWLLLHPWNAPPPSHFGAGQPASTANAARPAKKTAAGRTRE